MNTKAIERNTFIMTIWTFLYFLWFRWFMVANWDFEIFKAEDWQFIFHQWWYGGWIIQGSYYWIFVLSLFLCLPIWIIGCCFFVSVKYKALFEHIFWDVIYKKKTKKVQAQDNRIRIKRKKSYTEIRPRPLSGTPQKISKIQAEPDMMSMPFNDENIGKDLLMQSGMKNDFDNMSFSHREVADNFEGDSPFATSGNMGINLDDSQEPVALDEDMPSIMTSAGAQLIENPVIGDKKIDYIAVAKDTTFLILTDDQKGDWLADEERFNDEDPLWFSETSHRISPITTLKQFETALRGKLEITGISMKTQIILVKTDGNIINAEDMQDTWKQMNVLVARSATGAPEELPSFTATFPAAIEAPSDNDVEQIKKIVNG